MIEIFWCRTPYLHSTWALEGIVFREKFFSLSPFFSSSLLSNSMLCSDEWQVNYFFCACFSKGTSFVPYSFHAEPLNLQILSQNELFLCSQHGQSRQSGLFFIFFPFPKTEKGKKNEIPWKLWELKRCLDKKLLQSIVGRCRRFLKWGC